MSDTIFIQEQAIQFYKITKYNLDTEVPKWVQLSMFKELPVGYYIIRFSDAGYDIISPRLFKRLTGGK